MKRHLVSLLLLLPLLLAAASGSAPLQAREPAPEELPLPQLPDSLRRPADRAGYLIGHFWEAMDFRDTVRSRDRDFMEQNFVNFAGLFPHADPASRRPALRELLNRAGADHEGVLLLAEIAEMYLYEPDSPIHDEATYELFLDELLAAPLLDRWERIGPEAQLAEVRRVRVGTPAPDFAFEERDGSRRTLAGIEAPRLLLLFYDPACSHCIETIGWLARDPRIRRRVAAGSLHVALIYPYGDRALWEEHRQLPCPESWTVGMEGEGRIVDEPLYVLRSKPSIYLLDAEKTVLLKDGSLSDLMALLSAE